MRSCSIKSSIACASLAALSIVDNLFRLLHFLVTAPLVFFGLLPTPRPLVPSKDKYVLVTGASTGIGRDAALQLSRIGFSVIAGVRKTVDAEALRAEGLIPVIIDVATDASVDLALVDVQKFLDEKPGSQLVALVANAGVGTALGPIEQVPLLSIKGLFEVNVFGVLRTIQAFLPFIRASRGRVVLVSSVAGFNTTPGLVPYCMSKHAVESLADGLRLELAPLGASVSVVQPGPVDTPILNKSTEELSATAVTVSENPYAQTVNFALHNFKNIAALAAPVSVTSDAIVHAITAKLPSYRYRVTWPAYLLAEVINRLPTQVHDIIMYAGLKLEAR